MVLVSFSHRQKKHGFLACLELSKFLLVSGMSVLMSWLLHAANQCKRAGGALPGSLV